MLWTIVISLGALALGVAIGRYQLADELHDAAIDLGVWRGRAARATKALGIYGEHTHWCGGNFEEACNCGLAQEMRGLEM